MDGWQAALKFTRSVAENACRDAFPTSFGFLNEDNMYSVHSGNVNAIVTRFNRLRSRVEEKRSAGNDVATRLESEKLLITEDIEAMISEHTYDRLTVSVLMNCKDLEKSSTNRNWSEDRH